MLSFPLSSSGSSTAFQHVPQPSQEPQTSLSRMTASDGNNKSDLVSVSAASVVNKRPGFSILTLPNVCMGLALLLLTATTVKAESCYSHNLYFTAPLKNNQSGTYALTLDLIHRGNCQWIMDLLDKNLCNITRVSDIGNLAIGATLAKTCDITYKLWSHTPSVTDYITLSAVDQITTDITTQLQCLIDNIDISGQCEFGPSMAEFLTFFAILLSIPTLIVGISYCARKIKQRVGLHDHQQPLIAAHAQPIPLAVINHVEYKNAPS